MRSLLGLVSRPEQPRSTRSRLMCLRARAGLTQEKFATLNDPKHVLKALEVGATMRKAGSRRDLAWENGMSRSRRKTAIIGVTTAPSDKPFKVDEHRAERHAVRAVVNRSLDSDDRALHSKI
jgi:hypothetical protein